MLKPQYNAVQGEYTLYINENSCITECLVISAK